MIREFYELTPLGYNQLIDLRCGHIAQRVPKNQMILICVKVDLFERVHTVETQGKGEQSDRTD
jgi:hypothetical protein